MAKKPREPVVREDKEFEEVVVNVDRVARVVSGGRRFRFRALAVVGDNKNRVGIGISKGSDVQAAVAKAVDVAKKNLIKVDLYKETIPHEVSAQVGGAKILLKPASPGTGVIAGGTVRAVLGVLNIHNILTKSLGSSSKINVAYATIKALNSLVKSEDWVTNRDKPKNSPAKKSPPAKKKAKE